MTGIKELVDAAAVIPDPAERSRKYKNIVGLLSQEAVRSNDHQHIEEALKIAGMVTDDPSKAYLEIIRAIAKMKHKDKNRFDEAVKISQSIDNDLDLSVALHEIVIGFGRYGIDNKDDIIWADSLDLAQQIPLNSYRAMAYRNLSKAGIDPKKSLELLNISIAILEKSKEIRTINQIQTFCDTSSMLARLDDNRSYDFLKKAIAMADSIMEELEKSAVLLKILETEIEIGIKFKDKLLLDEAAVISKGIKKEYYKTLASNALESYSLS
ncbi:MAG: hypothetical protein C3F06_11350 [Candidatus Methanoperedenaceae archaeon]|nr:MAG: hypothetical protein C3F06_11350 [Candidatus Methanoperedenaceae archaeon]